MLVNVDDTLYIQEHVRVHMIIYFTDVRTEQLIWCADFLFFGTYWEHYSIILV